MVIITYKERGVIMIICLIEHNSAIGICFKKYHRGDPKGSINTSCTLYRLQPKEVRYNPVNMENITLWDFENPLWDITRCARLHPKDNYNHIVGKKVALQRAIEASCSSGLFLAHKPYRIKIWNAFYYEFNRWK